MKTCTCCNVEKELAMFGNLKQAKDGLQHACKYCINKKNAKYRKENPERRLAGDRRYRQNNREKAAIISRRHYLKNKEKTKERHSQWESENKGVRKAIKARRRAAKLNATISGYDSEIKEIYINCPEGHHVDHMVPLQGVKVRGLHVPWNLQYLTVEENLRKGNKLIKEFACSNL